MAGSAVSVCKAPRVPPGVPTRPDRLSVALDATPLLGRRTGVGMFVAGALGALGARRDLDVTAFAVSWRRRQLLPSLLPLGVTTRGRPMPARPLQAAWRWGDLPPAEWFVGPASVVHGTNYVVPPTRRAARVVTVHDLTVIRYPEMCDAPTLAFAAAVRRAIAQGAWVHTPSRFVADEVVAELGADPAMVRAVAHGIPGCDRPSRAPMDPPATRYVLAVGTVEPRKDFPGLVRAFDQLAGEVADVDLVIAGGDGWGADALDRAVERSSWGRRILRTGYVDDAVLDGLLDGASLLVYPSRYEGFGFPPLQAMDRGVPVVATAVGAIPEVVGDGGLLVEAGDLDAMAGAMQRLLTDASERARMVELGRARAAAFTWEACGQGLSDLYRAAAA